jgi:hypothetical protein
VAVNYSWYFFLLINDHNGLHKFDLKKCGERGLIYVVQDRVQLQGFDHGNEPSTFVKGGEFLD